MIIVFIRAFLLYILVIFALRLMGKRQLGELQPTELVITILISNIAALPIQDPSIPMIMGIIPILVLVGFEIIVSNISLKSQRFRKLLAGNPIVIISDGTINQKALKKLRFSIDDLMESLREQGIFDLEEVHYAVVETTGSVSILQKCEYAPVTPKLMAVKGEDKSPPVVIISDGKIVESAFKIYEIPKAWLDMVLQKNQQSIENIFLMTADKKLNYNIILNQ